MDFETKLKVGSSNSGQTLGTSVLDFPAFTLPSHKHQWKERERRKTYQRTPISPPFSPIGPASRIVTFMPVRRDTCSANALSQCPEASSSLRELVS